MFSLGQLLPSTFDPGGPSVVCMSFSPYLAASARPPPNPIHSSSGKGTATCAPSASARRRAPLSCAQCARLGSNPRVWLTWKAHSDRGARFPFFSLRALKLPRCKPPETPLAPFPLVSSQLASWPGDLPILLFFLLGPSPSLPVIRHRGLCPASPPPPPSSHSSNCDLLNLPNQTCELPQSLLPSLPRCNLVRYSSLLLPPSFPHLVCYSVRLPVCIVMRPL